MSLEFTPRLGSVTPTRLVGSASFATTATGAHVSLKPGQKLHTLSPNTSAEASHHFRASPDPSSSQERSSGRTRYATNVTNNEKVLSTSPPLTISPFLNSGSLLQIGSLQGSKAVSTKFSECPSVQEKRRLVFEELNVDGRRRVTFKHFRDMFETLDFTFSKATLEKLFHNAISNNGRVRYPDPSMSYSDFLNWAERYPMVSDAVYSRCLHAQGCHNRRVGIRRAEQRVQEMTELERAAQTQLTETEVKWEQHRTAHEELVSGRQSLLLRQREAEESMPTITKRIELALAEQNHLTRRLPNIRKEEQDALEKVLAHEHVVTGLSHRLQATVTQLNETAREEAELLAALEAVRGRHAVLIAENEDVQVELQKAQKTEVDVQSVYTAARHSTSEAAQAISEAEETVRTAQQELCAMTQHSQELAGALVEAAEPIALAARSMSELKDAIRVCAIQHEQNRRRVEEATKRKVEQENDLALFEASAATGAMLGGGASSSHADEQTLLNEEIRLREHEHEITLRDAALREVSRGRV